MFPHTKFGLVLVLVLTLSACAPGFQASPAPAAATTGLSPAMTETATLPSAGEPVEGIPLPAPGIASLQMSDADNGWAWTGSGRLLHTSDGGQTWADRTPGEGIVHTGSFFLDSQTAWQSFQFKDSNQPGLLQTSDGGRTWTQISHGPQSLNGMASALHFIDAMNGWAEGADMGAGNIYFSLSETWDGGKSWAPIPINSPEAETGLPPGTIHLCNICGDSLYYDPDRIIIVYGDEGSMESAGVVRTQASFDLGATWQVRNLALPESVTYALIEGATPTFFDDENGLLSVRLMEMGSTGDTLSHHMVFYVTRDGGREWSLLPGTLENAGMFLHLQVISSRDLFAICADALCASHDGASSWQKLPSNLDLTQTDTRSVLSLDFIDASTGWAVILEKDASTLYQTRDGGVNWTLLAPRLVASEPVKVTFDTNLPTPTAVPTPTLEPGPTPVVVFDPQANADRVRFAPGGTWIEINASISASTPKRYVLKAAQAQVMSVSIPEGPAFSVSVVGVDNKLLNNSLYPLPFWRGALPSTQDYIVTVESQVSAPFTLRIAIDPPGQSVQYFEFADSQHGVYLRYTDEFAPWNPDVPVSARGTHLLTLAFIDPVFYTPKTNLSEAYLVLAASADPAIVSTCTLPPAQSTETVTGQVNINNYIFTRSESSGAAAGNRYDQAAYRTVWENQCIEMIILIHSTNIGNYTSGTVVEYDRPALLNKFEAILHSFFAY